MLKGIHKKVFCNATPLSCFILAEAKNGCRRRSTDQGKFYRFLSISSLVDRSSYLSLWQRCAWISIDSGILELCALFNSNLGEIPWNIWAILWYFNRKGHWWGPWWILTAVKVTLFWLLWLTARKEGINPFWTNRHKMYLKYFGTPFTAQYMQ